VSELGDNPKILESRIAESVTLVPITELGRDMDIPPDNNWIERIKRSWLALGTLGQILSTVGPLLAAIVSILNSFDSLSSRFTQQQPLPTAKSAPKSRDINTGTIDEQRAREAAQLRGARAEAQCLTEREKAKEEALVLMNSTRSAHDRCLYSFVPTLTEAFQGITAKSKCAPHLAAFQVAESRYNAATEVVCKKKR
jgi:hypothetical protein